MSKTIQLLTAKTVLVVRKLLQLQKKYQKQFYQIQISFKRWSRKACWKHWGLSPWCTVLHYIWGRPVIQAKCQMMIHDGEFFSPTRLWQWPWFFGQGQISKAKAMANATVPRPRPRINITGSVFDSVRSVLLSVIENWLILTVELTIDRRIYGGMPSQDAKVTFLPSICSAFLQ